MKLKHVRTLRCIKLATELSSTLIITPYIRAKYLRFCCGAGYMGFNVFERQPGNCGFVSFSGITEKATVRV